MSAPFIFIATNRLKEGKLAAERDRAADLGSFIEKYGLSSPFGGEASFAVLRNRLLRGGFVGV